MADDLIQARKMNVDRSPSIFIITTTSSKYYGHIPYFSVYPFTDRRFSTGNLHP